MLIVGLGNPFSRPKKEPSVEERRKEIQGLIRQFEEYLAKPDEDYIDSERDVRLRVKAMRLLPQLRRTLETLMEDDIDD